MSLAVRDADYNTRIISVSGNFNFDIHREFRETYMHSPENCNFVIDLRDTNYLDSSALGMILLLREFVNGDIGRLKIINCNPDIKKIFIISNMDKIITLD